jgi:hypothetical protein
MDPQDVEDLSSDWVAVAQAVMIPNDTIEAQVARGAAWLDQTKPGWEREIDLAVLDMVMTKCCVLGQVFATEAAADASVWIGSGYAYVRSLPLSFGWIHTEEEDLRWMQAHGFTCWSLYEVLGEAWTALIKTRFDTGTLSG